jgi:hypothetical protein
MNEAAAGRYPAYLSHPIKQFKDLKSKRPQNADIRGKKPKAKDDCEAVTYLVPAQ